MVTSVAAEPRPVWDLVVAGVLLFLVVALAGVAALLALFLPLVGDSCGASTTCSSEGLTAGTAIALVGPVVVAVIALITTIRAIVLRRRAFWMPLVGLLVIPLVWLAGAAIAVTSVPGFTV